MGQRARQIAEAGSNKVALAQARLAELAFATPDARSDVKARIATLEKLRRSIADEAPAIAALEVKASEATRTAEAADSMVERIAKVSVPVAVASSADVMHVLDDAATEGARKLAGAEAFRKAIDAKAKTLPDLGPLEAVAGAHKNLAGIEPKVATAAADLATRTAAELEARESATHLANQSTASAEALEALRRNHTASELAAHLQLGQPCPVCRRDIEAMPAHKKPAALSSAEKAAVKAAQAARIASDAQQAAAQEVVAAQVTLEGLTLQRDELVAQTEGQPDALTLATKIEAIRSQRKALEEARTAEDSARTAHTEAVSAAVEARKKLDAAWVTFDSQRDPVVALKPPAPARVDLLADWTALASWAAARRPEQLIAADGARAAGAAYILERDQQLVAQAKECADEDVYVEDGADLTEVRDAIVGAAVDAKNHLGTVEQAIAEAIEIRTHITGLTEEVTVAGYLANHLKSTGFERWLVAEALGLLVEGASATLRGLSGGQYSLGCDDRNEFYVIDHRNADERRPAKTLSGGETFQASLALALALADQLAGLAAGAAAKLESIFLDEGFGTLDPETLATVADTVETLGSSERMVGIVTHVTELAERVPVRYRVTKTARISEIEKRIA